ncbi:YugN family protein [Ectobacillus antri]|jgi:hypothetical protein|uniref:YugN family protein n=1 Tax=Ectobacillus antri TaxID=2486280 RepID=A0ABT6H0N9_9BACI|nr:YugN family protein [Ectobacillus antri]MDG4655807.1 YugN family protein [Ectobacillus antri]MDG5752482.1 YugN family protein [Ectobacillus antri]
MKLNGTELDEQIVDFSRLTEIMNDYGFVLAGQWDYERATYDYKFELLKDVYYLRVQAYAIEGDLGGRHARVKLLTPLLGKHYYPHGVEYGEGEQFPNNVLQKSKQLLHNISTALKALPTD